MIFLAVLVLTRQQWVGMFSSMIKTQEIHHCECCGKKLNPKKITWLELDVRYGNKYHANEGEVPEEHSQGMFAFGSTCAAKIIKNGGILVETYRTNPKYR